MYDMFVKDYVSYIGKSCFIITWTYLYRKLRPGTYHDVRTAHFMGGTAGDYAHPRKIK